LQKNSGVYGWRQRGEGGDRKKKKNGGGEKQKGWRGIIKEKNTHKKDEED